MKREKEKGGYINLSNVYYLSNIFLIVKIKNGKSEYYFEGIKIILDFLNRGLEIRLRRSDLFLYFLRPEKIGALQ
jgi:hypothetical protein